MRKRVAAFFYKFLHRLYFVPERFLDKSFRLSEKSYDQWHLENSVEEMGQIMCQGLLRFERKKTEWENCDSCPNELQ